MIKNQNQFKEFAQKYMISLAGSIGLKENLIISASAEKFFKADNHGITEPNLSILINQLYYLIHYPAFTKIELFLTENCNLNCSYCFVKKKRNRSMSYETACDAINFLVFYSGTQRNLELTFFGGEPLLEADLICQIMDYCRLIETTSKQKKISFAITTNGTLIDEELMQKLKGRVNLLLSLDGDAETHDKYRIDSAGNGSFQRVLSKIQLIKKYQSWLGTRMTVLPSTVSRLYSNIIFLYGQGINQFIVGLAADALWDPESLLIYQREYQKIAAFYSAMLKKQEPLRMTFFEENKPDKDSCKNKWGCRAGKISITIDVNGDIYPCSKFIGLEQYDCPQLRLGSIYDGITNLSLSNKLNKMKNEDYPVCSACTDKDNCTGGCPADNYFENRTIYLPSKTGCVFMALNKRILKDFWENKNEA